MVKRERKREKEREREREKVERKGQDVGESERERCQGGGKEGRRKNNKTKNRILLICRAIFYKKINKK